MYYLITNKTNDVYFWHAKDWIIEANIFTDEMISLTPLAIKVYGIIHAVCDMIKYIYKCESSESDCPTYND